MTGQELINAAGRLLGELRGDRSFGATESAQLLVSLNAMIAAWSQEQFAVHQITRESLTLTGAASYTMGPSGNLNTTRPIRIVSAETLAAAGVRMPARVVTSEEWASKLIDDAMTGTFVHMVYPDYGNPQCTLRVNPVPSGGSLLLHSLKPLGSLATLGTAVDFPSGYEEALIHNFALKIAPEFGRTPSDSVIATAERGRKAIGATNAQLFPAPAPVEAK